MSYLPNDLSLDTTVSLERVQQNDEALDTAISGNLTQANFSAATQIPNSMLASPSVEEIITLRWGGTTGTILVASATQPIDCIPLYGSTTYTVLSASYTYYSAAANNVAGSISVNVGTIVSNAWSNTTTLVSSTALANATGATQTVTGNLTLNASTFTTTNTPTQLALICTGSGTTATPRLVVTLIVKRALQ